MQNPLYLIFYYGIVQGSENVSNSYIFLMEASNQSLGENFSKFDSYCCGSSLKFYMSNFNLRLIFKKRKKKNKTTKLRCLPPSLLDAEVCSSNSNYLVAPLSLVSKALHGKMKSKSEKQCRDTQTQICFENTAKQSGVWERGGVRQPVTL